MERRRQSLFREGRERLVSGVSETVANTGEAVILVGQAAVFVAGRGAARVGEGAYNAARFGAEVTIRNALAAGRRVEASLSRMTDGHREDLFVFDSEPHKGVRVFRKSP